MEQEIVININWKSPLGEHSKNLTLKKLWEEKNPNSDFIKIGCKNKQMGDMAGKNVITYQLFSS